MTELESTTFQQTGGERPGFRQTAQHELPSWQEEQYEHVIRRLSEEIMFLRHELHTLGSAKKELHIPDKDAKKILEGAITQIKAQGIENIDIIDLHEITGLPYDQINKIMLMLEQSGVVTDSTNTGSALRNPKQN